MAPPNEMSDEEQMRLALDLLDQIEKATNELRKTLRKEKKDEVDSGLDAN